MFLSTPLWREGMQQRRRTRSRARSRSRLVSMRRACPSGTAVGGMQMSCRVQRPRCRSHLGLGDAFIVEGPNLIGMRGPRAGLASCRSHASFPSFRRVCSGRALVTVTSPSRTFRDTRTPNKARPHPNRTSAAPLRHFISAPLSSPGTASVYVRTQCNYRGRPRPFSFSSMFSESLHSSGATQ